MPKGKKWSVLQAADMACQRVTLDYLASGVLQPHDCCLVLTHACSSQT